MALRISDFTDEEYLKYLQIGGGDISPYQGRALTDEEKNSIKNEILFRFDYNIGNFLKNAHFYTPKEREEARINMVSQTFEEGRSFYGLSAPRSNEEAFSGEEFRNMILYDPYVTEDMSYYYDRFAESRVGEGKINFPNLGGMTKKQFIDSFKAKNYLDDVTTRDEILTGRYGKENYEAQREEDGRHRDSAWMYSLRQTKNLFGQTVQLFGETADSIFGDPGTDGGFWDWFTKVGNQWSTNAVREIEEGGYQRKYNESFAETLRKKGPAAAMGKAFEMAAENWSNSGLSLALALVPGGGAYRATKILRGAAKYVAPLFSMLEAGGVREEMIEQGVYDPTKPMGAAIWGTAAAALDWVENMYVGGKMPASYLRNRLFSQLERNHARKAAQDKFTKEMLDELKRPFWYKLGRGVTIEGVTEGLQELAPIMASYQAETEENKLRKPYDWTFNISNPGSVLNRIVDASVVGGLMGGTTVTTAHTVGTISGDRKRRIDQLSGLTGQTSSTATPNYNGTSNGQPIQVNVPGAPNGTNYFQLQNNNWLATNGVYTGEGDTAENAVKQMFSVANKGHVPLSDPVQSAPDTFTLSSIIPAGSTANSLTVDVVGNNAQAIAEQVRDLHNNTTGNIVNLKATAANNGQIRIETNNIGSDLLTYLENLSTSEQRAEFPGLEARQLQMVRARNVPDALELDVFHYQHGNAQFGESDFFSEQDDTETKRQQRLKKISDDFRRMGFDFINTRPHKRPARSTSLKEIKVHKNGVIYTISLNTQSGSQGRDVQATVIAESLDGKAIKLPKGIAAQILSTSSTTHRGKVYFRLPTDRISVTQLQGMSGSNPTYQFESSEITKLFANTLGANITTNEADTVDFELNGKTGHMRIANDGTVLLHADGFLVSNFEFVSDLVQLGMGTARNSTVEQAVIAGTSAAPTSAYTDVVMPDLNRVPQDVRPLLPRVNANGEYAVKYLKKSTGTTDEYYAIYLDGKYATRGTYYSKLGPNHPMPKILKVLETKFGNPPPVRPTTVPEYEKFFSDNFGSQFNSTNVVQIVGGTANNKYIRVGYTTLNQRLADDIIYANTFSNNDVSVNFSGPGFRVVTVYTLSDSAGNTRAIRDYGQNARNSQNTQSQRTQLEALEELYDAAPFLANIIDGGVFAENPARQEENYIIQNDAPPEAIYDETNFTDKYDRQDSTHKNIMSDIRDYHNNIRLLCEEMSIIFNYIITNQKYNAMTTITASNIAVRDILNKLTQSILDVNGKINLRNQMDLLTGGNTNNLTLDGVRTLFAMELKRTYAKFATFMYIVESARRNSINSGNLAAFMSTNIGGSNYSVNDIANDNLRNLTRDQLNTETEEIFAGVNAVIQSTVSVGVQPFSIGDFGNIQNLTGKDYTNDNVDIIISNVTNLDRVKFYRTLGTERANRRVKEKEITIADELDLTASVGRDIVDGLTRNGRLVILETQEQAELVLNAINAEINYGKDGVTAGFTDLDNGVIYLVQDGIRVGEAAGALYHEFGVHLKRFGFTDPQFRDILTSLQLRVENMRQGNVLDEFYSEMADLVESKGLSRQDPLFWEEVNAHIITEAMDRNVADMDLIAKSVSWIKSFLYRHGFIKAENLNYQDLVNIVRSAMRTEARENNPSRIPSVVAAQLGIDTTPRRTPRQQEYQNIRDSISDTNKRFKRQNTRKIRKEIVTSGLLSRKALDRMIRNGNLTIMDTQEEALDFLRNLQRAGIDDSSVRFSRRRENIPTDTIIAYKLFRVDPTKPGKLFPLYVRATEALEVGVWYDAEEGRRIGETKVKGEGLSTPLRFRPGWHAVNSPFAPHIGEVVREQIEGFTKTGKPRTRIVEQLRRPNEVWAEVELVDDDKSWQERALAEAEAFEKANKGKNWQGFEEIPVNGNYEFRTKEAAKGKWYIAGAMKINRLLEDSEVAAINESNGVRDNRRVDDAEFDPKAFGVEVFYSKRGVIQGFTLSDGSAYLVSDGIPEGKAGSVLMHEVGVHARKFGFSDSQFQEILRGVQKRQNDDTDEGKAIQAAIERTKKAGTKEDSDTFWEEVVAYMVENTGNIESTLLDRIKAWIKKYLFKMGFVDARDLTQRDFVFFARGVLDSARYQTSRANLGIDNVRFSYTNEEGARRLDEAGVPLFDSPVTRLALLNDAILMESEGISSADIKWLTGWEKGTKDEWKWEMVDNNMTLNYDDGKLEDLRMGRIESIKLPEIISHPELYIAHPSAKDIVVKLKKSPSYDRGAGYSEGIITLGRGSLMFPRAPKFIEEEIENLKINFLHEIQHHIQDEVGFIRGGNEEEVAQSKYFVNERRNIENENISLSNWNSDIFDSFISRDIVIEYLQDNNIQVDSNGNFQIPVEMFNGVSVDNINDFMYNARNIFSDIESIQDQLDANHLDANDIFNFILDGAIYIDDNRGNRDAMFSNWFADKQLLENYRIDYASKVIPEIRKNMYRMTNLEKEIFDTYQKFGGELESRVVTDRFMMTEEERRRTPTIETEMQVEKISRDEVINPDELNNQVSLVSKAHNNTRVRFLINTNANVEIPSAIPGAPGVYQYKNGRTFIVQNELPRGLESETMMYGQTYANLGLIRRNPIVDQLKSEILANDYLREKITEDAAELGVDINSDTGRRKVEDLAIGLGVRRILTDPNIDDSLYQNTLDVFRDVVGDAVHLSYDQEYISPSMMAAAAGALSGIPPVKLDVSLREGFAARKRQGITDIVWNDVNERLKLVEENSDYIVINNAPSVQLADGAYVSFEGAQDNPTSVREALHDLSTRTIDEGIDDDFFYRENPNLEAFEQTGRSYGILSEMANRYNVEDFINKALPAHIAERIEVHYNETDYAKGILKKAAGIIFPFSYTKKIIHVRAWGRTLGEVIRTIGHEVSHFGWSIWNVPEFNSTIVKFYNTFEDTLMNTIPEYFAQIGYANPTPGNSLQALLSENEKIFLVNEFYSHINMSLLDNTTPNVADAMGIDSAEYAKIRDEINNGIALIETKISDIFGNTNVTQDTAKAFAKDMLKMTFGSVIGRKLNIVFDQGRPNNVGFPNARIRIFANEFGVVRRVEPLTKDAERSANYKEVVTKWDKYFSDIDPKWGKYGKMFAKFMLANIPMSNHIPGLHVEGAKLGDTPTGRITLMVGRLWQRIANSFQIDIKEKFNLMQELNAILMDNNYDPSYISYTNSYTDVFRRLGLSQKDIEKAKLLDDSVNYMRKLIYEGSVEIQKAFHETGRRLRQRMLTAGISQARADAVYTRFIQLAGSFHSNWEHRSYEAFTQEGQADLKEMLYYLNLDSVNGQDGIYSQAAIAQSFIDTSEALLRNGQISESEYQRRTKEARHTIEIRDRLEALREYVNIRMRQANMTPDGNWNAIVVRNMKAEINEIIKKANQLHSGALGREHLNMISASKGRKLDENFIVDQKYMKFLKQIQNPIYVLIDSIDQQRKIVEKIRFNIEVGEYILDSGMGSLREQKGVSGIDDSLALSFLEKGSFLEYIEVDPFFLEDIQKEIEIVKHANEIMWRGIIDAWKANSTIYNLRLGINNHVSNVGMLVFAGHAFRLGQIMSGHHIAKSQFLSKFKPDQDGNLSDFEKKMMRWLHQYRVFGGTVSEMELVTRNTGWHEKVVHATTSMLKAMSLLENRSGHHFESFMLKWIERMKQFYAFGDEWVKPLIFINNWNNFYAKYDASESLAQGETEEQRIARIEELAARDAAEQTLRESTTWEYSPQFIRQLSTNAARQFTPDFIMHNFQMLRIMSSNVVRWTELWRELVEFGRKQNKTAKDYKWGKAITAELAQRSVGLGLLGGSFAGLAGLFGVGGAQLMAFVPYLMNVLYKGLGGDDDDEKMQEKNIRRAGNELVDKNGNILEERGWFTPNEWDGWQRLLNFMTGGNNLYAPAWRRDNESISAWNWLRSNVMYTHAPVMPAKENPLLKDRALIIMQNIANINGETMARQFIENAFGRDRYGNDIGLIEGWKQIAERTLVPGGVRQIMGATIGYPFSDTRYHEGRFIKSTELFGLHFNNYDRKDITNKLGFFMAERMEGGKNRIRKNLILRLQDSRDYTNEEIASMIRDAMADNLNSFNKANYVLIGLRKTYMPEEDIKQYLKVSKNTGGIILGEELVSQYLKGVNIFDTSLVKALNNRRNQLIEKKRTLRMNPDQYDVAIRNLGTAIRMYTRALDRDER